MDATPPRGPGLQPLTHGLRVMDGRDPAESHRAATPLELLFDLAFVVAFGVAGEEFAHLLAEGHWWAGVAGFLFAMFAVVWAWINFTWFASAYDTDDWVYRLTTMVQMVGVVVLALGLPAMFESLDGGTRLDSGAMVAGYVVMRVPMVAQWLRAARQDPDRREVAHTYAVMIVVAQLGWVLWTLLPLSIPVALVAALALGALEAAGPMLAERRGEGSPWHPHHVAERYGLLAIVAFGEVLIGTVASLAAVIDHDGWTVTVAVIGVAGVGLTFGLWWVYFMLPAGDVLHHDPDKSFAWGYGHVIVYGAIAAVGAGLHVVAFAIEGEAAIPNAAVMATVGVPAALYFLATMGLFGHLIGLVSSTWWATPVKFGLLVAAVVLAAADVALSVCMLVAALAPVAGVVAEESGGGDRRRRALDDTVRGIGRR